MDEMKDIDKLRERAKKRLECKRSSLTTSEKDVNELIEDLSIHQEELKIQNEELKRIQCELEASRAKYFELYDLAPVGYITLTSELVVREANLAAPILLGTDRNNLINRGISIFISPKCQELLYLHFRRLAHGEGKQKHVFVIRRKDASELSIQFESNVIEDGPEKGFRSVLTDVTELRHAQRAQKDFSNDLERSNYELQQFAYVASHDLREPLRMVRSFLELLEKKYRGKVLDEKAEEYIDFAVDGAARMQAMIDDILTYARVGAQNDPFILVDMENVLGLVLKDLDQQIKGSAATMISGPMPEVIADPLQMYQLMQNLISNAIKFRSGEAPRVRISAEIKGNEWVFTISDNGIGIDESQKDRLFQMFQRLHTKEKYEGTGIGLAISRKIVERHGGRIWVESEVGNGSTFFFTLPMSRPV